MSLELYKRKYFETRWRPVLQKYKDIFIISREVLTKAGWISLHGWKDETYFSFACQFFFFLKRGHRFHSERAFSNNNWQKKKKASASLKSHLEKRDGVSSNKSSKHARHGDVRLSWKVCAAQRAHSEREESSNTGDFCELLHVIDACLMQQRTRSKQSITMTYLL